MAMNSAAVAAAIAELGDATRAAPQFWTPLREQARPLLPENCENGHYSSNPDSVGPINNQFGCGFVETDTWERKIYKKQHFL